MTRRRWSWMLGGAVLLAAGVSPLVLQYARRAPPSPVAEYCDNADGNFRAGRITAAVVDYNRAIALDPAEGRPYIGLAVLYEAINRPDLAILALEQLQASNPAAPHLACRLAEAHLGADDVRAARDLGQVATAREPNCARAFSVYGIALVRYRYWDSAESAIRRARQLAPEDTQISEVLLDIYSQQGTFSKAVTLAEEVLRQHPNQARVHYQAGWARGRLPQTPEITEKALSHLRRAAELDPHWLEPLAEMGRVYRSVGRRDEALASFEAAWRLNMSVPGVAFNLAALYRRKRDPRAGAIERRFRDLLREQGKFTALRRDYNQEPGDTSNALALARLEGKSRLYATALHRLRKILAADPANIQALQLYARLDREARAGAPDYLLPGPGITPALE
jgi:Flp pilus assembly protein TadD